ncbi:MAG TPA: helix-turn-helix domain-containing protein [Pseudolysinimonas sp.]|jgi:excisionase family DNA binding protein|nr:helix-turn-helix domain-containing protein [Pseudolysinimonas sp.]
MVERLLTVDELRDELQHIGRNTAYNLVATGMIRHVRTGTGRNARILIPESAVADYLAGRTPASLVASVGTDAS